MSDVIWIEENETSLEWETESVDVGGSMGTTAYARVVGDGRVFLVEGIVCFSEGEENMVDLGRRRDRGKAQELAEKWLRKQQNQPTP